MSGFLRGGTGFLKGTGEIIKGSSAINREVRVGVTHVSFILFVSDLSRIVSSNITCFRRTSYLFKFSELAGWKEI